MKKDIFSKVIKFIKENKVKSFFILVGCILLIKVSWALFILFVLVILIYKKYNFKNISYLKLDKQSDLNLNKCPHCKEDIKTGATKCPHCQSVINNNKNSSVLMALFIIFLFVWIFISFSKEDKPKIETKKVYDNIEICIESRNKVKYYLKSPSTAEFPDCGSFIILNPEENKFIVNSYVDSQNSFSAMIRSRWIMTLHIDQNNNIVIDSLTIDGGKIF